MLDNTVNGIASRADFRYRGDGENQKRLRSFRASVKTSFSRICNVVVSEIGTTTRSAPELLWIVLCRAEPGNLNIRI